MPSFAFNNHHSLNGFMVLQMESSLRNPTMNFQSRFYSRTEGSLQSNKTTKLILRRHDIGIPDHVNDSGFALLQHSRFLDMRLKTLPLLIIRKIAHKSENKGFVVKCVSSRLYFQFVRCVESLIRTIWLDDTHGRKQGYLRKGENWLGFYGRMTFTNPVWGINQYWNPASRRTLLRVRLGVPNRCDCSSLFRFIHR